MSDAKKPERYILIDWLSVTSKTIDLAGMMQLLGMQHVPWQQVKGHKGYRSRQYWESISIHYDGGPSQGVWLELSGAGCRAFESYGNGDYQGLLTAIIASGGNITRIDIALDLINDTKYSTSKAWDATIARKWVSRWTECDIALSISKHGDGKSLCWGSGQSDIRLRMYDKLAEQRTDIYSSWDRLELQCRDDRARAIADMILAGVDNGKMLSGVLRNYLRYVRPDVNDVNPWRWPIIGWWEHVLKSAEPIRLWTAPGADYDINNLKQYVIKQAGNALDAYIQLFGINGLLADLDNRDTRDNPKYAALIAKYGRCEDDGKYN